MPKPKILNVFNSLTVDLHMTFDLETIRDHLHPKKFTSISSLKSVKKFGVHVSSFVRIRLTSKFWLWIPESMMVINSLKGFIVSHYLKDFCKQWVLKILIRAHMLWWENIQYSQMYNTIFIRRGILMLGGWSHNNDWFITLTDSLEMTVSFNHSTWYFSLNFGI